MTPGRHGLAAVLVAALALAGCGHAKTTDAAREDEAARADNSRSEPSAAAKAEASEREAPKRAPSAGKPDPDTIPVATSPEGLLRPGAEQKIRDKLEAGGFLQEGSTRAGLRRFQHAHDLPETGMPDHTTVSKLGLDPDELFRKQAASTRAVKE